MPNPPTATVVVHSIVPSKRVWIYQIVMDTNSSTRANERTAAGGDDFYVNKYERPFSQSVMDYYPDIDI